VGVDRRDILVWRAGKVFLRTKPTARPKKAVLDNYLPTAPHRRSAHSSIISHAVEELRERLLESNVSGNSKLA
jgi:hypothetical protein